MRELWRRRAGIVETAARRDMSNMSVVEILNLNWSKEYERLCKNRMIMGAFRYGFTADQPKGKYDTVQEAIHRIQAYQRTGNTEYLVDAGNMCMIEFMNGVHPTKHFAGVDDGEHAQEKR